MTRIKNSIPRTLLIAVVAAAVVAAALLVGGDALARAGGGDRFPSGGGGGGFGGGGDGDGLFYIVLMVWYILPFPLNLIVILIIVGVAWFGKRRMKARRSGGYAPSGGYGGGGYSPAPAPPARVDAGAVSEALEELRKRDPLFSRQHFEDTVSTAFIKIQEAWSKRQMDIARPFITPSLLTRFQAQIDELKRMGRTNHVEQATIGSVDMVEADHDGGMDYVTARVVAAAADYTTEDKTGQIVAGTKSIRQFTEYWTFMRSDKVKTEEGKEEVASKHCPNCGAPMKVTAVGKCDYCGSDITSGQFSWVLSEITQASAWRPRAQARRPQEVSPLAGERYVLGLVQCPSCGANVQDVAGITNERCWRCGGTVETAS